MDKFNGYNDVRVGSLIHILKKHSVDTSRIFEYSEKFSLNAGINLEIDGRIFENRETFNQIKEVVFHPINRGKKILLVADTGTGKSYALTKLLHQFNNKLKSKSNLSRRPENFAIYACPRRALIQNLKDGFSEDGLSVSLTGSDNFSEYDRQHIINNNFSFLTTIDHASHIINTKVKKSNPSRLNRQIPPAILITDEAHTLATDASFKLDSVRKYLAAEQDVLNMRGISLHVTATPENLHLKDYDMIVQVNQNNRSNPFTQSKYTYLDSSNKKLTIQFLQLIQNSVIDNPNKKLLIFIEDTDLISHYCDTLKRNSIEAVGITAKKNEQRKEEELQIINNGIIPSNVQVVLATTVLSSGVSIINNSEKDETWVLCSSTSQNYELTQIVQMSHRFRNKYKTLQIIFQQPTKEPNNDVHP